MTVAGIFRVLDDPNRFFWIRAFESMPARKRALTAFYGGDLWKAHRETANSMLIENDNVLLLRPARPDSGFRLDTEKRTPIGARPDGSGLIVATIYSLGGADAERFDDLFEDSIRPAIERAGGRVAGVFVTDGGENDFPQLPVREDANAYAWLTRFTDRSAYARYLSALASDPEWDNVRAELALRRIYLPPEVWQLEATPRSVLR